jgi:hypothetical protein
MSESQLQIVISVINDAGAQLAAVGAQLSTLADQTASDALDMSASMSAAGTSIEDSLTAAEQSAIAAAEATLTQWTEAAAGIDASVGSAAAAVSDEYAGMGNSAALAAAATDAAWQASVAELESAMSGAASDVEEDFAAMGATGTEAGSKIESSISSLGGKLTMIGVQAGIAGGLLTAGVAATADAAGQTDDAFDQLRNTIKDAYDSAGAPTAGYATTVADLTAKIDTQNAAIAEAGAAMQKWTGTTAEVAASHEKAAAAIETAQVNLQKLQQQLDQVTSSQQLTTGSAADTTAQFEAAARANTNFGFTVADSATALQFLFASTSNVNETMSAYQDAMDLAAAKGIDLATASNAVIQAMSGQGRSLRDLGIQVADGLSGQTALAAIQQKVSGAAQEAATQGLGPFNVAMANLNKASVDAGNTILPLLTRLIEDLTGLIDKIDAFAQAHPKMTEGLLAFALAFGAILLVLAPLLIVAGSFLIIVETFNTLSDIGIFTSLANGARGLWGLLTTDLTPALTTLWAFITESMIPALTSFASLIADTVAPALWAMTTAILADPLTWLVVAVVAAVASMGLLAYEIYKNWDMIKSYFDAALKYLTALWNTFWDGFLTSVSDIWGGIGAAVQKGINYVEGIISGFAATIQNIYKTIMAPINAITGAASSIAGAVGGGIGTAIKAFASGGIVNSPTLALVGEAGPEAIIPLSAFSGGSSLAGAGSFGGGGNIIVNINGGSYLDQGGATMIADALAKSIGRQLKLKNYF